MISHTKKLFAITGLAALLTMGAGASAVERAVMWTDALNCRHMVKFDFKEYDDVQVQNTMHMIFGESDFDAPLDLPRFSPQSLDGLDPQGFTKKCSDLLGELDRLKFLPMTGIEEFRRAKIAHVTDACTYRTILMRGFRDASALREYKPASSCSPFIDALEGKSDIMIVFRQTLEQTCRKNLSPDKCKKEFLDDSLKPDGIEWVRLSLLNFGWNNCANKFRAGNVERKNMDKMQAELKQEFQKTFKIINVDKCGVP